jgi:2-polyprenyl-3-methyl-5-hydroxy-6-metoxy-1,4-benzoquinol methylase
MNSEHIQQQKQATIAQFGKWTAHNIQLVDDVYTMDNAIVGDEVKLRRITQIVADVAKKPLNQLRMLDLACLEGLYGIELARHGSQVVGIEGRESNLAKARFTKEALSLDNLTLLCEDVRNLNVEHHGYFDGVLCLGILYHLDVPDVFAFLEKISEVCQGFVVIDTHVGDRAERSYTYKDQTYWGTNYQEHAPQSTLEERAQDPWASLDNVTSFWFTRPSLYNILAHLGFTTIYECFYPTELNKHPNRFTFVAIKGEVQPLHCAPLVSQQPIPNLPELPITPPAPESPAQPAPAVAEHPAQPDRSLRAIVRLIKARLLN